MKAKRLALLVFTTFTGYTCNGKVSVTIISKPKDTAIYLKNMNGEGSVF